jgi:hypothetical protein
MKDQYALTQFCILYIYIHIHAFDENIGILCASSISFLIKKLLLRYRVKTRQQFPLRQVQIRAQINTLFYNVLYGFFLGS